MVISVEWIILLVIIKLFPMYYTTSKFVQRLCIVLHCSLGKMYRGFKMKRKCGGPRGLGEKKWWSTWKIDSELTQQVGHDLRNITGIRNGNSFVFLGISNFSLWKMENARNLEFLLPGNMPDSKIFTNFGHFPRISKTIMYKITFPPHFTTISLRKKNSPFGWPGI